MTLNPKSFLFITSFIPVVVFKIIARTGEANLAQAKIAAVLGFCLALLQYLLSRKYMKHTTYLEKAFLGFLGVALAWIYFTPLQVSSLFVDNSTSLLYFVLFLTTLIPQLIGYDPFTYVIAKQRVPEGVWNTPQFRAINLHITYFWSGLFLLACLSSYLGEGKPLFSILIPLVLICGIGLPFSWRYPDYYLHRTLKMKVDLRSLTKVRKEDTTPKEYISQKGEPGMVKILAVQGSPRPKASNTEILLKEFLKGAQSQGAETETIYLKEKTIHPCVGCFTCWTKTPGVCVFEDDMPELLEKVRRCNILVYATPLYVFNMTAYLKAFQDRLLPLLDPHLIKRGDTYRHPLRYDIDMKMVLLSNCGFPESSHFDGLCHVFRQIEQTIGRPIVGQLLVPAGELLKQAGMREKVKPVLQAVYQAGVEVMRDGRVSEETEAKIQEPVVSPDELAEMANLWWDSYLTGVSKEEPQEGGEKVEDMRLLFKGMAVAFNAQAAGTLKATIQFEVSGKQPGNWFLAIADGRCTCSEGKTESPTLTVKTPSEVWLAIANKELDGQQAFMEGKYTVQGDMGLLIRMKGLFGSSK